MARRPVDEKIVKLSMDNADLLNKAQESTSLLSKLTNSLNKIPGVNLGKTTRELGNISDATKNIPMDNLSSSVASLESRFSTLGIIGMTALQNITNKAVDMGLQLAKSLTLDQVGEGFREYELKMGSIRTILANTEHEGASLDKVKVALEDLNRYADLTIYNFGQMTDSIGRFTAAGVGLDDSTIAIKGMSNLAATSGATSHQLNSAMYQMSQALASGRFNLMDWNSLVNSGMGGKITQDGLLKTAKSMGKVVDMSNGFRESIGDGWLTADVFIETMKRFAEDESMLEAATKIRTFSQLIETVQESIGSGLGMTFEHIFGDFEEASDLFSSLGDSMTGWIDNTLDRFNEFVGAIADGGGFLNVFSALGNILKPFGQILGAVADGFGKAFKSITPEVIVDATEKFLNFTKNLKLSEGVVNVLSKVFEFFFTGIRIGFTVIKDVVKLAGIPFVELGKRIKDMVGDASISIPSLESIVTKFSKGTASALSSMGEWLGKVLSGSSFDGLNRIGEVITSLTTIFDHHYEKTGSVLKALQSVVTEYLGYLSINFGSFSEFLSGVVTTVGNVLRPIWEFVKEVFSGIEFRHLLGGGFLVGLGGAVKRISESMGGLEGVWENISALIDVFKGNVDGGGFLKGITDSLKEFSDALKSSISIGNIVAIASAIGILAVSMKVLEDLNTAQVTRGMAAIAGAMFTLSWGVRAISGSDLGGVGGTKLIAFAATIKILVSTMSNVAELSGTQLLKGALGLSAAAAVLATTVSVMDGKKVGTGPLTMIAIAQTIKILVSTLEDIDAVRVEGLVKGLGTIGLLMAGLAVFANVTNEVKMSPSTSVSLLGIAGVIKILVDELGDIDAIRVEGLVKGLGTIGILLAEIAVFANVMKGTSLGPSSAIGVLGIAGAMVIMSDAIRKIDDIRVEGLVKGLGTIGIILAEIAVFANVTRETKLISSAAGITAVAVAMNIMVPPLKELGEMRWKDLVKGLGTMAGALGAIAIAGKIATGTLGGAAAIVVMSFALGQIAKPIEKLSSMSWGTLVDGLLKMALALGAIAGASMLLAPAVGPMLSFSGAMLGFGASVALLGGGLSLFAAGLATMAGFTATTVAAIITAIELLLEGLTGLVSVAGELLITVIATAAGVIEESAGTIVNAVIAVIMAMLEGIDENIEPFMDRGASIILKLIEGLDANMEPIVVKAVEVIISMINAMAQALDEHGPQLTDAFVNLMGTVLIVIIDAGVEMLSILLGWIPGAEGAITNLGEAMTNAIREAFGLDEEVDANVSRAEGNLDNAQPGMKRKSGNLATVGTDEFKKNYLIDKVGKEKGEELIRAIESGEVGVNRAGTGLGNAGKQGAASVDWSTTGGALADGLAGGISSRGGIGGKIWNTAWNLGKTALSALKNAIDSRSPSKLAQVEGDNFGAGFANGIKGMVKGVQHTTGEMGRAAIDTTNQFLDELMTDIDREVHVRLVVDTSGLDSIDGQVIDAIIPNTDYTSRMIDTTRPQNNQNENNLNTERENNTSNDATPQVVEYHSHLHAMGSLPKSTIDRMAKDFDESLKRMEDSNKMGRGEPVIF